MPRDLSSYGFDRWLLALAFLAGAGGTVALKVAQVPNWIPAAFAGGIILAYAASVWTIRTARLEPEQIGDNAYYLGFILTLCSLAYTLWSLGTVEAETAFVAEVVAGFGVALTSTVVGVAVRVFLMQFRVDIVAREREAQLALSDGMAAFRSEIADAIRGTRYLGVEIRQTLAQHHRDLAEAETARVEATGARLASAFETAMAVQVARTTALDADVARRSQAAASDAQARIAAASARLDSGAAAVTAEVEARLDAASACAVAAAEVRLERTIARFEAAANRSSAALAASTAAIGQAALAELRAHREAREDRPDERPRVIEGGR